MDKKTVLTAVGVVAGAAVGLIVSSVTHSTGVGIAVGFGFGLGFPVPKLLKNKD